MSAESLTDFTFENHCKMFQITIYCLNYLIFLFGSITTFSVTKSNTKLYSGDFYRKIIVHQLTFFQGNFPNRQQTAQVF